MTLVQSLVHAYVATLTLRSCPGCWHIYLLVTNPTPNPFAACSGLRPLCSSIITHLTHANVWESMRKPCSCTQFIKSCISYKSCENPYPYCKSCDRENLYQVLQVTCAASECAMKSIVCCRLYCYSCCALITIQMATNLSTMVILIY